MTSSPGFAIWQSMPTRYQFTLQERDVGSSFLTRGDPKRKTFPQKLPEEKKVTTEVLPPTIPVKRIVFDGVEPKTNRIIPKKNEKVLSPRKDSSYLVHVKFEKRAHSAFVKSLDKTILDRKEKTKHKRTKSAFPVTALSRGASGRNCPDITVASPLVCKSVQEGHIQESEKRMTDGVFNFDDRKGACVTTVLPRKYVVRESDNATMYIDKGKVVYFRKSRHNTYNILNNLPVGVNKIGGFIYDTRKVQMQRSRQHRCVPNDTPLQNYKLNPSADQNDSSVTDSSKNGDISVAAKRVPVNTNYQHPGKRKMMFFLPKHTLTASPSPSSPLLREDTFSSTCPNSQSRIGERQFYLQTPQKQNTPQITQTSDMQQYLEEKLETCTCAMCRLEMQLAAMAATDDDEQIVQHAGIFRGNARTVDSHISDFHSDTPERKLRRERYKTRGTTVSENRPAVTISMPRIDLFNQL